MDRNERDLDDNLARDTAARDNNNILHHDDDPSVGDEVGEAVGGISGVLAGAAIGSVGGPIGTIIGGIAGAVSGWWAGRAVSEAASRFTHDDDAAYRTHYESSANRLADRGYDDVRPAYQLGHLAGANPDYRGRSFDEIEGDLRRGWTDDVSTRYGSWDSVRGYARDAYERGRTNAGLGAATATGAAAYGAGRAADDVGYAADRTGNAMERGTDRTADAARDAGHDVKRGAENLWDKTKAGAEHLGHAVERGADRTADAVDDTKDRVDGNPASRPGPDATDSPRRL